MKKYVLGITAAVLALSLSAFTTAKTSDFVYFPTLPDGTLTSNTDGQQDENAFECPDTGERICAKGYQATDASKVQQISGIWELVNPSASVDNSLNRP